MADAQHGHVPVGDHRHATRKLSGMAIIAMPHAS